MIRGVVFTAAIAGSLAEQDQRQIIPGSYAYTTTLDAPVDSVKSIYAFDKIHTLFPYIGFKEGSFTCEYSDGNNLGSKRSITLMDSGNPIVETKIGEGENHYTYGADVIKLPDQEFVFVDYRSTVHMIGVSETQTLVSYTGTFRSDDVPAVTEVLKGFYSGLMAAVQQVANKEITSDSCAYTTTLDVPVDTVKSIYAFNNVAKLLPFIGFEEGTVDVEYSDGDNIGSTRALTIKAAGITISETKLGDGENHFTYGADVIKLPGQEFVILDYSSTVHMIGVSETQTLVSYTGSFRSDNVPAAKAMINGLYAAILVGVEKLAAVQSQQEL